MATTTRRAPRSSDTTDRPGEDRRKPTRPVQIGERRRSPRTPVVKQCKVFHRRLARFVGGETSNVSSTGLLLRVDRARPVMVGDEIQVAVAWDRRVQMLPAQSLRAGRVVRVTPGASRRRSPDASASRATPSTRSWTTASGRPEGPLRRVERV